MPKFRKKPVVIEAFPFTRPMAGDMPPWLHSAMQEGVVKYYGDDDPHLIIKTLEGDHRADVGDWIIQGVKGELYPCKPDIFEETYDPVE